MPEDTETDIAREGLSLQDFMNDMDMLGNQTKNRDLIKPNFHYGDLSVTNYLLWLILGELTMSNNN